MLSHALRLADLRGAANIVAKMSEAKAERAKFARRELERYVLKLFENIHQLDQAHVRQTIDAMLNVAPNTPTNDGGIVAISNDRRQRVPIQPPTFAPVQPRMHSMPPDGGDQFG